MIEIHWFALSLSCLLYNYIYKGVIIWNIIDYIVLVYLWILLLLCYLLITIQYLLKVSIVYTTCLVSYIHSEPKLQCVLLT